MNRRNYDRKIIMLYDTTGSFFVDIFYNDLFLKARSAFNDGRAASLTDAYKSNVTNYVRGISMYKKLYMGVIRQLYEYYRNVTKHSSGILFEFVDLFLNTFIPKEYYSDFNERDKDKTLYEIIVKTVTRFGDQILKAQTIRKIVDDHKNEQNVIQLQDSIVDIFLLQREEYYAKFTKQILNENSKVSLDVFNVLKAALKEETTKRIGAESERDRAIKIINALTMKIKSLELSIDIATRQLADAQSQATRQLADAQSQATRQLAYPRVSAQRTLARAHEPLEQAYDGRGSVEHIARPVAKSADEITHTNTAPATAHTKNVHVKPDHVADEDTHVIEAHSADFTTMDKNDITDVATVSTTTNDDEIGDYVVDINFDDPWNN